MARRFRIWLAGGSLVAALAIVLAVAPAATLRTRVRLPTAQLVWIARGLLAGLGDQRVSTAQVVASTQSAAEQFTYPGSSPPRRHSPRAYLIVVRGSFVCAACSGPAGAKAPRGTVAYDIWVPGRGITDFGLQPRMPGRLDTLGPVTTLPLVQPRVPASELVLHPGSGIGAARLGARLRSLSRAAGPALAAGEYVFGPIDVHVRADHGRIDQLAVLSAQATIEGHRLSEGYSRLRRELRGWRALRCGPPDGPNVLVRAGEGRVSTRLEFAGARFNLAFIGAVPPGACLAPFPAG